MARASIRFYAELNDFLPVRRRGCGLDWAFHVPAAVKDVIESCGVPHTEVELVTVNGRSVGFEELVRDGDRVAVYPMFESLDVRPILRVRPEPLRTLRFVLDVHLGRLARYLRMLGFDTRYLSKAEDRELVALARAEQRILLTRDRGVLKHREVTHGYWVRSTAPRRQLAEVVERFDLACAATPFTRCLRCNGLLRPASAEEIETRAPKRSRRHYGGFQVCSQCRQLFWAGSHYARMKSLVEDLVGASRSTGLQP